MGGMWYRYSAVGHVCANGLVRWVMVHINCTWK
jgi:hypothetical protein